MILNKTYFQSGRYKLPNLNEPEPNLVLQMDLETLIETSEEDVLSKTFGIPMYEDFMTYIVDGDIDTLAPENYQKLFKGAMYSKDGKDYYFKGLVDFDKKYSLLVPYVYHQYWEINITQTTEFGQAKIKTKVGLPASSIPKMVDAWNRFVSEYSGDFANVSGYTDEGNPFIMLDRGVDYYCQSNTDTYVSLIKFLVDNKDQYPLLPENYKGISLKVKNSFGL